MQKNEIIVNHTLHFEFDLKKNLSKLKKNKEIVNFMVSKKT
jgi:hypothetical protein